MDKWTIDEQPWMATPPFGVMPMIYHTQRSAQWGHWNITFCDVQPDHSKNYGRPVARVFFPVGNRGPIDSAPGQRMRYRKMIADWIEHGALPATEP